MRMFGRRRGGRRRVGVRGFEDFRVSCVGFREISFFLYVVW